MFMYVMIGSYLLLYYLRYVVFSYFLRFQRFSNPFSFHFPLMAIQLFISLFLLKLKVIVWLFSRFFIYHFNLHLFYFQLVLFIFIILLSGLYFYKAIVCYSVVWKMQLFMSFKQFLKVQKILETIIDTIVGFSFNLSIGHSLITTTIFFPFYYYIKMENEMDD